MLDAYGERSSPADRLRCFNASGDVMWELRSDNNEDVEILGIGPDDVVVTANEQVVLLNIDSLHLFDRAGNHLKKISLDGAFGDDESGRPIYLHEVVADADGGFLVADSGSPPVVLRYRADGSLRSRWSPRHPDGKTFDLRPEIRVAPDGRLWTGDGRSLLRLTDDGVVDLVIGPKYQPDRLEAIAAFNVGPDGRLYVVAQGTSNVHVFDAAGKLQRIVKPDPGDVAGTVRESFVAVNDQGTIYLKKPPTKVYSPPDEYFRFSPEGDSLDTITFLPALPVGEFRPACWAFQPGTGYVCGIAGDDRLVIVDPPDKLVREVCRRPNGRWLGQDGTIAMAPDGSIAVLDHDIFGDEKTYEIDLFSPTGEPLRTLRLPPPARHYSGLCQDGQRAVVAGNAEVVIVDLASGRAQRFDLVPPGVAEGGRWSAFISAAATDELLLFGHNARRVYRYKLPPAPVLGDAPAAGGLASRPPDAADSVVRSPWVRQYLGVLDCLPKPKPCVLYAQEYTLGERLLTADQAAELPDDERAKLRTIDLTSVIRWDGPRLHARLLDIVAQAGLADIQGTRVLDLGCCDLRTLQTLARLGVDVTHAIQCEPTVGCNDWSDVGDLIGPDGQAGHLSVVHAYGLDPDAATTVLDGGYGLITLRNILHEPAPEDYFGSEHWCNLANEKKAVPARLFALLEPGGWLLIYNADFDPIPAENSILRREWEAAGFTVTAFDVDDRGAAIGIGTELGFADPAFPDQLRARYSLLRKLLSP